MASWTRSALALSTGNGLARKHVEDAHPACLRIAARHVMSWVVLQKKWTRHATEQAKCLSAFQRKMIEVRVAGGRVAGHHVSGRNLLCAEPAVAPQRPPSPPPVRVMNLACAGNFKCNDIVLHNIAPQRWELARVISKNELSAKIKLLHPAFCCYSTIRQDATVPYYRLRMICPFGAKVRLVITYRGEVREVREAHTCYYAGLDYNPPSRWPNYKFKCTDCNTNCLDGFTWRPRVQCEHHIRVPSQGTVPCLPDGVVITLV